MSRRYFQFPLCALSYGASEQECLNHIISYACVEHGKRQWWKCSSEERRRYRSATESPLTADCHINLKDETQVQAALGAAQLNMKLGSVTNVLESHQRLATFISSFEQRYGRDAQVRIVTSWVFEARDKRGISYIELATLIAIYSKIGAKKSAVRITRDEIWRRAHGCKSKPVFEAACGEHMRPLYTPRQIRAAVDRLHARRFFCRLTFARRQTYYSHRLTASQLADSVVKKKTLGSAAAKARELAGEAVTRRVREELYRLTQRTPL
jgi:hypothetical protein